MPELQELAVAVIVAGAALYVAWRFGLIPRRRRGVTTVVRVSDLKRRRPGGKPPG